MDVTATVDLIDSTLDPEEAEKACSTPTIAIIVHGVKETGFVKECLGDRCTDSIFVNLEEQLKACHNVSLHYGDNPKEEVTNVGLFALTGFSDLMRGLMANILL